MSSLANSVSEAFFPVPRETSSLSGKKLISDRMRFDTNRRLSRSVYADK